MRYTKKKIVNSWSVDFKSSALLYNKSTTRVKALGHVECVTKRNPGEWNLGMDFDVISKEVWGSGEIRDWLLTSLCHCLQCSVRRSAAERERAATEADGRHLYSRVQVSRVTVKG